MMILILLGTTACSDDPVLPHGGGITANVSPAEQEPVYRPDLFPETTVIPFEQSLGMPLEPGTPLAGAKLFKSFMLPGTEAEVLLYTNEDSPAVLTGYLKGRNSQWKLGDLNRFDEHQAWITPLSFLTGAEDVSGVSIEVPFGSIGAKSGLLVYYHKTDSWDVIDFQGHSAIPMDLDRDGMPEWIGNQTGWVPPALELHRWNPERQRFESTVLQTNLFPEMDNDSPSYSALFIENGQPLIQIGREDVYAFFSFERGSLKKLQPEDTRNRVLEMMLARRH